MLHPARNHGLHGPHSWQAAWVKLPLYSSPPRGSISCTRYYAKTMYPSFLINPTLTFSLHFYSPPTPAYIHLHFTTFLQCCTHVPRGPVIAFLHVDCWIRTRVVFVSFSDNISRKREHVGSINNFKVLAVITEPGLPAVHWAHRTGFSLKL
ncbi:hypothetical protein VNO80_06967 [Phaseolus coccineus]|uniref:Uncharacterized protein n=1 Tax=Phaseolus coccineus TaxID=3886 RepID=A0AAN9NPQ3_PHACN